MGTNEGVRVEAVPDCLLCLGQGVPLYTGLRDRLFDAPGIWGFFQCPQCGLIWLNPRPVLEHAGKVYSTYYTHAVEEGSARQRIRDAVLAAAVGCCDRVHQWGWRQAGRFLYLIPPVREAAKVATMYLGGVKKGRLLEVGCGSGRLLAVMRDSGWEVLGVEPDNEAARVAQQRYGVPVVVGTLPQASLPDESFDVVMMSHVIEHLYDPVATLRACRRVLKIGGKLVVLTPNSASLGHFFFRQWWVHLDPPRHHHIFSIRTLGICAERAGFCVDVLRATARNAGPTWTSSRHLRRNEKPQSGGSGLWGMMKGIPFGLCEAIACGFGKASGEELLLIATKKGMAEAG
jgi:2-polyprenyl-3-methyl-5-hydroxy-6-metoxy-1,4-benzoquinol methylase